MHINNDFSSLIKAIKCISLGIRIILVLHHLLLLNSRNASSIKLIGICYIFRGDEIKKWKPIIHRVEQIYNITNSWHLIYFRNASNLHILVWDQRMLRNRLNIIEPRFKQITIGLLIYFFSWLHLSFNFRHCICYFVFNIT